MGKKTIMPVPKFKKNCYGCIGFCIGLLNDTYIGWCTIWGHDTSPIGGCISCKNRDDNVCSVYPLEYLPNRPMYKKEAVKWYKSPYLRIRDKPRKLTDNEGINEICIMHFEGK